MNEILKASIDNIRLSQIQRKVELESLIEWSRKTTGSPMPKSEEIAYHEQLGKNYQQHKRSLKYKLW